MDVISPIPISDSAYVAGNLTENDYPEWAAGQTLKRGDYRMISSVHSVYQSLRDHTSSSRESDAFSTRVNKSGGYSASATSIVVDDVGAANTGIDAGDTITLGTVTAIVQSVDRNTETLTLRAGLDAAVADNAAVERSALPAANSPTAEAAAVADPLVEDPDPLHWVYIGQTNKWRLFDGRPSQGATNPNVLLAGINLGALSRTTLSGIGNRNTSFQDSRVTSGISSRQTSTGSRSTSAGSRQTSTGSRLTSASSRSTNVSRNTTPTRNTSTGSRNTTVSSRETSLGSRVTTEHGSRNTTATTRSTSTGSRNTTGTVTRSTQLTRSTSTGSRSTNLASRSTVYTTRNTTFTRNTTGQRGQFRSTQASRSTNVSRNTTPTRNTSTGSRSTNAGVRNTTGTVTRSTSTGSRNTTATTRSTQFVSEIRSTSLGTRSTTATQRSTSTGSRSTNLASRSTVYTTRNTTATQRSTSTGSRSTSAASRQTSTGSRATRFGSRSTTFTSSRNTSFAMTRNTSTPQTINEVALINLIDCSSVTVTLRRNGPAGAVIYTRIVPVDDESGGVIIGDIPDENIADYVELSLSGGAKLSCGQAVLGSTQNVGDAQIGDSGFEGLDFSHVETNIYGDLTTIQRSATTLHRFDVQVPVGDLDKFATVMHEFRGGKRALWVGDYTAGVRGWAYGFARDWQVYYTDGIYARARIAVQGVV